MLSNYIIKGYLKGLKKSHRRNVGFQSRCYTVKPDLLKDYNIKLNKCVKMKSYEEGILLFQEMKSKNIAPDTLTYKLVFELYDVGMDPKGAQAFMEELNEQGIKTQLNEINNQITKWAESVDTRRKAAQLYDEFMAKKQAGVNLFNPPM